ncbi:hypothetical protein V2598_06675 [Tenacibaculum maritimum]|uniref:hypothetical protein n=1 Tax=Tenacibaculum maritimum TaxID=107401 RepID=UPI003877320C
MKKSFLTFSKWSLSLFLIIIINFCSYSQITVSGNISFVEVENKKINIEDANVLIRDTLDSKTILTYATSDANGFYKIDIEAVLISDNQTSIIIEVSKYGYETTSFEIKLDRTNNNYQQNIVLVESVENLQPVLITTKPRPIKIKNDTTTYAVSRFKDGSENSVEDLLKNLPGIEVGSDGIIKFKNRPIDKVLIEGDDLFNNNYTVGTKNISANLIDKIEAIEKWNENALLKNIKSSEKIALNLKLKDGLTDFSGNSEIGYGIDDRYAISVSGLMIQKRFKNFTSVNYNNTGKNSSPYNFTSLSLSPDEIKNIKYKNDKLIAGPTFNNIINSSRPLPNNNIFGNTNQIVKLSEKLSVRFNLSYYQDQFTVNKAKKSEYFLENSEPIILTEEEILKKEPQVFDGDFNLTWNSSKKSLTEFNSKWYAEHLNTENNILSNNVINFNSRLNTEETFLKQELIHTRRINDKKAIEIRGVFSNHKTPQLFSLQPAINFENDSISNSGFTRQQIDLIKNSLILQSDYLISNSQTNKTEITAQINITNDELLSSIVSNNTMLDDEFTNKLRYKTITTKLGILKNLKIKKINLSPAFDIKQYNIQLFRDDQTSSENRLVISPKINVSYAFNETSKIYLNQSYDESPIKVNNLFNGFILSSFRSVRNYNTNIIFQKKLQTNLGYEFNDLYQKLILKFDIAYFNDKNNFLTNNRIGQNLTINTFLIVPESLNSFNSNFSAEKFIPYLSSTARLSINYSSNQYKNIVNNSVIRDNKINFISSTFYFKTAFDFPINIQNSFKYNRTSIIANEIDTAKNSSIINNLNLIWNQKKRFFTTLSFDYFKPNLLNPISYLFLDANLSYRTKNNKIQFTAQLNNVTNINTFNERQVSDIGLFESSQSLNERFYLLKMKFNF